MRKLNDIAWNVDEPTYRQDEALSYSTISKFKMDGFKGLKSLYNKVESPSLLFGSVVDTLVTDSSSFDDLYVVIDLPELSDNLDSIARFLAEHYSSYNSLNLIDFNTLAKVGEDFGYFKGKSYENTRVKRIIENCDSLFKILKEVKGKTVISSKLYKEALACYNALKECPDTSKYFSIKNPFDDSYEIFYQLKFKSYYEGIPVRCMFDGIYVDYNNKTITPIDLKTSSKHESEFYKSWMEWNYYIQSNLYTYILSNCLKDTEYKDFKITHYLFIVVNRYSLSPMVWKDNLNFHIGNMETDYGTIIDWRNKITELWSYIGNKELDIPNYPIWKEEENDLHKFLNTNNYEPKEQ